jgi:hypothetical protein
VALIPPPPATPTLLGSLHEVDGALTKCQSIKLAARSATSADPAVRTRNTKLKKPRILTDTKDARVAKKKQLLHAYNGQHHDTMEEVVHNLLGLQVQTV